MKVSREIVYNEWGLPFDDNEEEGIKIISDEIVDTGRWSIHHELIVKIKDKFYKTTYSIGATEYQEERPWEYDKEVEFTEVKPVEKTVIVYEPV